MHRFWDSIVQPVLSLVQPRVVVEIGTGAGDNTRELLEFCRRSGAVLHSIDPAPTCDAEGWEQRYRSVFRFHRALSLDVLHTIDAVDAVLIDGDHNWYTVFHELKSIQEKCANEGRPFPLVLLHDVGWPYGRRDLYYDPEHIPAPYRQPHRRQGMRPGLSDLVDTGGLNAHLLNAIHEHGPRNGVLTAVADFLAQSADELRLVTVPALHGLGILVAGAVLRAHPRLGDFLDALEPTPVLGRYLEVLETRRLELEIAHARETEALRALREHHSASHAERQQLGAAIAEARRRIGQSEARRQQLEIALADARTRIGQSEAGRQQLEIALAEARTRLTESAAEQHRLSTALVEAHAAAEQLREQHQRTEAALEAARATADRAAADAAAAQRRARMLEEQLATQQRTTTRLTTLLGELDAAVSALLATRRWTLGNAAGHLIRRVMFKASVSDPAAHVRGLLGRARETPRPRPAASEHRSRTSPSADRPPAGGMSNRTGRQLAHAARVALGPGRRWRGDEPPAPASPDADAALRALAAERPLRESPAFRVLDGAPPELPLSIVIPVFNAPAALRRCLEAVVRNTTVPARLVVIDDASTDPRVRDILATLEELDGVTVLQNHENLGFTRTANRGFAATPGDVVLLNSDCEVPPRWLENLILALRSRSRVATVTPLSNNAGAFSAPRIGHRNSLPPCRTLDDIGRLVAQHSERRYPTAPTGNGYCLYVRRAALRDVGDFDAEAFPRGYGEENDFCVRALRNGWLHLVDDATYVVHERTASFGGERSELVERGRQVLDERYPDYAALVGQFVASPDLAEAHANVAVALAAASDGVAAKLRVLYVLHDGTGGTPQTNRDLMAALQDSHTTYVFLSNTRTLGLWLYDASGPQLLQRWDLDTPIAPTDFSRPDYRDVVVDVLTRLRIDLVHIRHLLAHTFDLPPIAHSLGIPVVLSFHDYYLSCPTVHLLDEQDRFCGGTCTAGSGACRIPSAWLRELPRLKHAWVHTWRERVRADVLSRADAFVTTSSSSRDVVLRSFPELPKDRFSIIEHGRDFGSARVPPAPPEVGGRVRILVPGNIDVHKGATFLRGLRAADSQGRLELHFMGRVPNEFADLGVCHGVYDRSEFLDRVASIRPAFVGVFSIWAETYSHVLTEAVAAGTPVIATALGAPAERIQRHGGGLLVDASDPAGALQRILGVADDPPTYRKLVAEVAHIRLRSVAEMRDDYVWLYASVLQNRRPLGADRALSRASRRVLRIGLLLVGSAGTHPGSAHVRLLRRFQHPDVRPRVVASVLDVDHFVSSDAALPLDAVAVQRTAVPPDRLEAFLTACRRRGTRLMFDLDDDLVRLHPGHPSYEEFGYTADTIRRLVSAADLVTVSTAALRDTCRPYNARVEVVPNMLDEQLWLTAPSEAGDVVGEPGRLRLLYMGTTTHARDLALLRPALRQLRREGLDVQLSVIGGEPAAWGSAWYTRIRVPAGLSSYPRFVPWLRSQRHCWDAAVAPLEVIPFNQCKSDLKFLEYAALQLPGIFSDAEPYAATVKHGETGLLTANTPDAWATQLRTLLEDVELRARLRREALAYLLNERLLRHQTGEYLDLLFRLAAGR